MKKETPIASAEMEEIGDGRFFVASSPVMHTLRAQAELLAKVNVPVLIVGERGSGKELTAKLIHKLSVRSAHIFLKVDCATLRPDVLEREILGDEQDPSRATMQPGSGQYDPVSKGTVLFAEIPEMPPELQAPLLRIVQDSQFYTLGNEDLSRMKVRILASITVDAENTVCGKDLHSDLYNRLSTFTIHVPPLRQRKEEIPFLISYFTWRATSRYALPIRKLSPVALEACEHHSWPGNVAELENFVIRYLVMGDEALVLNESGARPGSAWSDILAQSSTALPFAGAVDSPQSGRASDSESALRSVRGRAERDAIASALEKTRWNRKAAARLLLISYRALLYKIRQYHMSPPECLSTLPSTMSTLMFFKVIAIMLALTGLFCARPVNSQTSDSPSVQDALTSSTGADSPILKAGSQRFPRYELRAGDVLNISFEFIPEFNQTVPIQPDGFITLRDVGDIQVSGLTVPQLTETIRSAYRRILKDPVIAVALKDFEKPYFIANGQVARPGKYDLRGDTTVVEAIALAGGFVNGSAKHSQVLLYRRVSQDWMQGRVLDVKKMMQKNNLSEDMHIKPGDMIIVPQNRISKIERFLPLSNVGINVNPFP